MIRAALAALANATIPQIIARRDPQRGVLPEPRAWLRLTRPFALSNQEKT